MSSWRQFILFACFTFGGCATVMAADLVAATYMVTDPPAIQTATSSEVQVFNYEEEPYQVDELFHEPEFYTEREYRCHVTVHAQRSCDWENVQRSRLVMRPRLVTHYRQVARVRSGVRATD